MSAYINPYPEYAWNGTCASTRHLNSEGADAIYGDAVVVERPGCSKSEYHMDCAIEEGILCGDCGQFECVCEEVAKEAA